MSVDDRVNQLVRPDVLKSAAYKVAPPGNAIRLNQMENPFGFPMPVWQRCLDFISTAEINRYPDADGTRLKKAIKQHDGLGDLEVMLGNGSDEIIACLIQAVCDGSRPVMAPAPTFVMFEILARQHRVPFVSVDLNADFSLDVDKFIASMKAENPALVFLAQPNNPTGNLYPEADLRAIIEACPGLVVIDEAYGPFSSRNHQAWLAEYDNLVLMRTFSKMGLAGLRCGYLTGPKAWITEINKVRLPYNLGILNQAVATFALTEAAELMGEQAAELRLQRARLFDGLIGLGLKVYPSEANFLIFEVDEPKEVNQRLVNQGVLIKDLSGAHRLLSKMLRVSIGTEAENTRFLDTLRVAL